MDSPWQIVDHYRIVGFIGRGGMGDVYDAYDEVLQRRVALKAIREEFSLLPEAKQRFLREAQTLSKLEHPGICRIYDLIEAHGEAFLVLEFIEGRSLASVISEGLGQAQALALGQQIADALVAAHQKGVIHRDLKPENVMVTPAGEAKILDFGLSRLVIEEPPEATEALALEGFPFEELDHLVSASGFGLDADTGLLTHSGKVLGTAGYLSPEQACGREITSASDIYAFGLVLQELFTGKRALDPEQSHAQRISMASKGESRPLEGLDPDLTTLVQRMKSMEPHLRPSAVDVSERLAWIGQKPRRRRRKLLVGAAMTLLSLLTLATAFQSLRATRAEKAARLEAETSKQVSQFLTGLFSVSDPGEARGNQVTARELLDQGAARIEQDLKNQPVVQAKLMETMGIVYYRLGLYQQTQPLFEKALCIREGALGANHPDVAAIQNNLANLYAQQGQYAPAEALYRKSLATREKMLGAEHPSTAATLSNLAILYKEQGQYDQAEPLYRRSVHIAEKRLGPDHPDVANNLNGLANLLETQHKFAEAEPLFQRCLRIRERGLGPDHPLVASTLNNLAILYKDQKRYDLAEPLYQRSLAIREKVLGAEHPEVGESYFNLANLYCDQNALSKAEPLYEQSIRIFEKAQGAEHPNVAQCLYGLAKLRARQGKSAEAIACLERAFPIGKDTPWMRELGTEPALLPLHGRPAFDRMAAALAAALNYPVEQPSSR